MRTTAFFGDERQIDRVFAQGRRARLAEVSALHPQVVNLENWPDQAARLGDVEAIFSTWGMPMLTAQHLAALPRLRAVFYAAGSVQGFARPLLAHGVTVVSAWQANGVPVAEFALAQILLANKGYFANTRAIVSPEGRREAPHGPGNFGATVALLGAGAIGRLVIKLLKPFRLRVVVFDPFLSDEAAAELGVEKVSLEEAFATGNVVSNHLANNAQTVGLLREQHFGAMRRGATFINTGRGATVDEDGLLRVLRARPDLTALLDVTYPEPPVAGSALYELPNVQLSSHIAGSLGDEVVRMADFMLEEFDRWSRGEPLRYAVTPEMLETMA